MGDWAASATRWFNLAQSKMSGLLHSVGQDDETVTLIAMALVALVALTVVWAVLLAVLRGVVGIFVRPQERSGPRDFGGFDFDAAPATQSPGRLDIAPSALDERKAPKMRARTRKPATGASRAAAEERAVTDETEPTATRKPQRRLSEAAGASSGDTAPRSALAVTRQVRLTHLPKPANRGSVVSARPEWTGKVVPSSLQDAGAVEVCRVMTRRASPMKSGETVRAVDYRVCGLPRVDGEGRRQPDVFVYTVADRGFLPKSTKSKPER